MRLQVQCTYDMLSEEERASFRLLEEAGKLNLPADDLR